MEKHEYTLDELIEQRDQIERAIADRRAVERRGAMEEARALIEKFDIQASELYGRKREAREPREPNPPKYHNQATGQTWTGRGRAPAWIKDLSDEERAQLLVSEA